MFARIAALAAALALSSCSASHGTNTPTATLREAAAVAEGPPLVDGVYTFPDCEGEGGCPYRNWRTVQSTPLLAGQTQTAGVITTLLPEEWVHVEQLETRLLAQRGVVREGASDFQAGEVVYALANEGEGFRQIWRHSGYASVGYDDPVKIDWEQTEASSAISESLGTWARVQRENGQTGWVRLEYGHFECLGPLAGDSNCRD